MTVPIPVLWGQPLSDTDYNKLAGRWITREFADAAGLRRVDSATGRDMFARKRGDMAGMIIPNIAPWDTGRPREYRERLDSPDLEYRIDGTVREMNKYVQPPGRPNLIYFAPGVTPGMLEDGGLPVIITEGEFKTLALWRLATHESSMPRFLPIGLTGVWNWKGCVGKREGTNGATLKA